MAHAEKETYGSYPTDAFDNTPSGPVGVHRGRRSLAVRVAPFVVAIVAPALAGLLTWGIASGELNKVPWPWAQQSAQTAQSDQDRQDDAAADDGDDTQADADAQDDAADQGEADGQDTDGAAGGVQPETTGTGSVMGCGKCRHGKLSDRLGDAEVQRVQPCLCAGQPPG